MYGIELQFNDDRPLTAWSQFCGLSAHLCLADDGSLNLRVTTKYDDADAYQDHWFGPFSAGDRVRITYRISDDGGDDTFEDCESCEPDSTRTVRCEAGLRWGLDFTFVPRESAGDAPPQKTVRLSYPPGGSFSLLWGNFPLDCARCFVMAENDEENWQWQMPDSHDGDAVDMRVVQTDWNTPFPKVERG